MARHANVSWSLPEKITTYDLVQVAVLMDIRDEIKILRRTIESAVQCPNTIAAVVALKKLGDDLRRQERVRRKKAAAKRKAAR